MPRVPRRNPVPFGGIPVVDWNHPLAVGLVAAYVIAPFGNFYPNLAIQGGDQFPLVGHQNYKVAANAEGRVADTTGSTGSLWGLYPTAVSGSPLLQASGNAVSMLWRGTLLNSSASAIDLVENWYGPQVNPTTSFGINNNRFIPALDLVYYDNTATRFDCEAAFLNDTNKITSVCGTIQVGGNMLLYLNGAQVQSAAAGANPIRYSATPGANYIAHGLGDYGGRTNLMLVWNRVLAPSEVAQLHLAPYDLFIWPSARRPVGIASALPVIETNHNFISRLILPRQRLNRDLWQNIDFEPPAVDGGGGTLIIRMGRFGA